MSGGTSLLPPTAMFFNLTLCIFQLKSQSLLNFSLVYIIQFDLSSVDGLFIYYDTSIKINSFTFAAITN